MQTTHLSKQDENRIKKLEEAARNLEANMTHYYSITKLTCLKSLCTKHEDAIRFGLYIANLLLKKVNAGYIPPYTDKQEWESYKALLIESISLLNDNIDNKPALYTQLNKLVAVQNETRTGHYGIVIRTIYCNDLLIIEKVIKCILSENDYSDIAYRIARSYTEKYNPHAGTGLIKESLPMLQDIIHFWRGSEGIN